MCIRPLLGWCNTNQWWGASAGYRTDIHLFIILIIIDTNYLQIQHVFICGFSCVTVSVFDGVLVCPILGLCIVCDWWSQ